MDQRSPLLVDHYIGRRMLARRKELGISQVALATAVGVTFQQMQKYERGLNRASASRIWEIARVLGVSPEYFFPGSDGAGGRDQKAAAYPKVEVEDSGLRTALPNLDEAGRSAVLGLVKALSRPSQ